MDWLNIASGGLLGLVGSVTGAVMKYFQTGQTQAFEEKKWEHELSLLKLQHSREHDKEEYELSKVDSEGGWRGLTTSIDSTATEKDSYRWVNAVKSLYRPLLTTGLFILVYFIFLNVTSSSSLIALEDARELVRYIIDSVVFTASTAGVWWFGDRAFAPPGMKNR